MIDFSSIGSNTFWFGTILPLTMIFGAGLMIFIGFLDYRKTRRMSRFPTAPGIIIKSEIVPADEATFKPKIRYRFEVGGRIYESGEIFRGQKTMYFGSETVKEKIAPYPLGKTVQVYYDPENPEQSILEIKSQIKFYLTFAVEFIIVAAALSINFWLLEIFQAK